MTVKEIYKYADMVAPFVLSREYCERYGARDNSGVQLDCGEPFDCILFSLDLTESAIRRAKEIGAGAIFTHHPSIFNPLYSLSEESGACILECAKNKISVLSAHLNLDCAKGGIDETLMNRLGGKCADGIMHKLSLEGSGYGRIYSVENRPFSQFAEQAKTALGAERVLKYGDRPVQKVASFCGAGMDDGTVAFALRNGADTFVSSDPKHHLISALLENNVNILILTHYAAENAGFYEYYRAIKKSSGVRCEFFTDARYL